MQHPSNKNAALLPALMVGIGLGAAFFIRKRYRDYTRTDLRGQVAVITGGSRGLGLAIAREMAAKGVRLVLCARTLQQLNSAGQELRASGCEVLTIQADVRNPEEVTQMITQTIHHFGKIDILINNAGIMTVGPENVMEVADYKKLMDTNLWASLYTVKATLPYFQQQGSGHIVNICSIGGKVAVPHMLPYSVSKFALVGLSQGLASELRKDNITVTTVTPNLMRTGSPGNVLVKGDHESEYAWFKIAGSLPGVSQNADTAARCIVDAIARKQSNLTLTLTAKMATALQGTAPSLVNALAALVNRWLPSSNDERTKKGIESESKSTRGIIGSISDRAAIKYNQH